jgi:hypothetical protein
VDDLSDRLDHHRRRSALEDVASHIDVRRALLDRLVGHRQSIEFRELLAAAMTIGTGQPAVTCSKPASQ